MLKKPILVVGLLFLSLVLMAAAGVVFHNLSNNLFFAALQRNAGPGLVVGMCDKSDTGALQCGMQVNGTEYRYVEHAKIVGSSIVREVKVSNDQRQEYLITLSSDLVNLMWRPALKVKGRVQNFSWQSDFSMNPMIAPLVDGTSIDASLEGVLTEFNDLKKLSGSLKLVMDAAITIPDMPDYHQKVVLDLGLTNGSGGLKWTAEGDLFKSAGDGTIKGARSFAENTLDVQGTVRFVGDFEIVGEILVPGAGSTNDIPLKITGPVNQLDLAVGEFASKEQTEDVKEPEIPDPIPKVTDQEDKKPVDLKHTKRVRVKVKRKTWKKLVGSVEDVITKARLIPAMNSGESMSMIGFKLFAIAKGEFYDKVGFKNNDILLAVDTIRLDAPEKGFDVFNYFVDPADEFHVYLQRGEEVIRMEYVIRDP